MKICVDEIWEDLGWCPLDSAFIKLLELRGIFFLAWQVFSSDLKQPPNLPSSSKEHSTECLVTLPDTFLGYLLHPLSLSMLKLNGSEAEKEHQWRCSGEVPQIIMSGSVAAFVIFFSWLCLWNLLYHNPVFSLSLGRERCSTKYPFFHEGKLHPWRTHLLAF